MVIARLLFGLPLALAALGAAPGQFRASVDGVRLEALVVARGQSLPGLTARDFTVTDNGIRQSITYEPADRTPGWHAVDVSIPRRRGTTIHARRGYQR